MDYQEAVTLSTVQLEHVLVAGTAPERVYATWALAERVAGRFKAGERLATEPDAGVRRHLLIIVAGNGRLDLLRGFSAHDPDPGVRAHATRLRWQCCPAPARPDEAHALATLAVSDAAVRGTVLELLGADFPAGHDAGLAAILEDEDPAIRESALRLLLLQPSTAQRARVVVAALVRAYDECERAVLAGHVFASVPPDEAGEVLRLLGADRIWEQTTVVPTLPFRALAFAFDLGDRVLESVLADAIADPESIPVQVLASRALEFPRRDRYCREARGRLAERCLHWLHARACAGAELDASGRELVDAVASMLTDRARLALDDCSRIDVELEERAREEALALATAPRHEGDIDAQARDQGTSLGLARRNDEPDEWDSDEWAAEQLGPDYTWVATQLGIRDDLRRWVAHSSVEGGGIE